MAETLPINIPIPTETAIASYPYSDISEGTGTTVYTGTRIMVDNTAGNDEYILTALTGLVSAEVGGEPKTEIGSSLELNFDVTFNTKKIVNGDILCMIPYEIANSTAATTALRILKWDGSSETELVASITFQSTSATNGHYVIPAKIPISNKTFKAGETFRLELITTASSSTYVEHDPSGSISSSPTGGVLSVSIPFKIRD